MPTEIALLVSAVLAALAAGVAPKSPAPNLAGDWANARYFNVRDREAAEREREIRERPPLHKRAERLRAARAA